jgi:putative flippase GtrA
MPYCRSCGVQLPEDAMFCPNCGRPVEVKAHFTPDIKKTALRYLVIGLTGAFLSVLISFLFSSIDLYFIPSFVASIISIYTSGINEFKESLIATFAVYLIADGILGTLNLGMLYILNETYTFMPIAAYIGTRISPKRKEPISVPRREEEGPGGVVV